MRLALFPSSGLGDGIIQLVLAQTPAKLGIDVDYYHHLTADLEGNTMYTSGSLFGIAKIACWRCSQAALPKPHRLMYRL